MDWGDAEDFVHFGAVSGQHIDDCDYYILLCPQNVVGNTIMTGLLDMVRLPDRTASAGPLLWHELRAEPCCAVGNWIQRIVRVVPKLMTQLYTHNCRWRRRRRRARRWSW